MKSSQFLVVVLLWGNASGSLTSINEDFTELKNDLPMRAIDDIVSKQSDMINMITAYTVLKSNFQGDYKHGSKIPFLTKSKVVEQDQLDIDIHTDVIFVGFPAAAVESVRAKWFEPLTHEDQVMASIGQNSHVIAVPGDLKVRHHFHLVQISFFVADSIREYVSKLLIRSEAEGEESYINAWELEEVLDDLSLSIGTTHNIKSKANKGSDDTLFIMNIEFNTPGQDIKYFYRNGFSNTDLSSMAEDKGVIELVGKILQSKRATRIDLPSTVPVPLFDKENNNEEYLERETVKSSTSNDRVHWRDAVSVTRDWAKNLASKTAAISQSFSLRERALRILKAPSDSPLGTHKQSLAIAIKKQIKAGKKSSKDCIECSAATWVGGGRVMFRDLHVSTAPPVHRSLGNAPSEPHPRDLSDSEWLGLGYLTGSDEKASRVGSTDLDVAHSAMERHLSALSALSKQSQCSPTERMVSTINTFPGGMEKDLKDIATGLYNKMTAHEMTSVCAGLALQIQLIEVVLEGEQQIRRMSQTWMDSDQAEDLKVHVDDFKGLLSRVIEEALEISNPLLAPKATQVHSGRISEQAAVYLGHLTSYVLQTVRYRVSPPMALRIDRTEGYHESHHADHQEGGLSITALSPITDAVRRRVDDAHSELEALGGEEDRTLSRNTHVYTGESLLEVVLSDHAYKYRHDERLVSGSVIRGERRTISEAQTQSVWRSLLPSILFPSKIDIVIYIVNLQSQYEPIAESVGDNLGFDFTTFMAEVTRLKLPNQQMTIGIQVLDKNALNNEKGIGLGLSSCRREGVVPDPKSGPKSDPKTSRTQFYQFFDASCVWSHLHPFDEKNVIENKFKADKKLSMHTQHLPIFLLSVDTPEPTLLADQQQATVVGDMVVILQNQQVKIQSEVSCYKKSPGQATVSASQTASGRNPLSAALAAVAEAVGGLAKAHSGHKGLPTSPSIIAALNNNIPQSDEEESLWGYSEWSLGRHSWMRNDPFGDDFGVDSSVTGGLLLRDFSSYLGESPAFEASGLSETSVPRFSTLELDSLHRSRVLRSLGVTRATKRHILSSSMGSSDAKLKEEVDVVRRLVSQALAATDASDWPAAAGYANSAYIRCLELHSYFFSHIHDIVVTAATTSIHSHNNTFLIESVIKNTVEEIDLEDQDSFLYFYTKFVFVCAFFFISCFNGVKSIFKYYKNRRILR